MALLPCWRYPGPELGQANAVAQQRCLCLLPMCLLSGNQCFCIRISVYRYATGAIRNLAVDDKGRRAVLAQNDAVAALKVTHALPPPESTGDMYPCLPRSTSIPFAGVWVSCFAWGHLVDGAGPACNQATISV